MALERDFMMNEHDFINLFSSAYIASRRDEISPAYFSDYEIFEVPANNSKAVYFKFYLPNDGWFDFCIKQYDSRRVTPFETSRLKAE